MADDLLVSRSPLDAENMLCDSIPDVFDYACTGADL